jgi:hypothetical protein
MGRFCLALLLAFCGGTQAADPPPAPDFSNVTDILNGARFLLRDDDLLTLSVEPQSSGPGEQALVRSFFTSQGNVTSSGGPLVANQIDHASQVSGYSASMAMGRMFDLGRDFGVVLAPSSFGGATQAFWAVTLTDTNLVPNATIARVGLDFGGPTSASGAKVLAADFTGDGFEDALAVYSDERGVFMTIVSAKDVETPASGIVAGPRFVAPSSLDVASIAVGDFDGNGSADIAVVDRATGGLRIYAVDRTSLAISQAAQTGFDLSASAGAQLVAGRFRDTPNQELVLVTWGEEFSLGVTQVAFAANSLTPTVLPVGVNIDSGVDIPRDTSVRAVHAIAAPLQNFFANIDQLVVAYSKAGSVNVAVVPFAADFSGAPVINPVGILQTLTPLDIVAGNFDNVDGSGNRVPGLQLALLTVQQPNCFATIYSVDSTSLGLTLTGQFGVAPECLAPLGGWRLVRGDTQGRSQRLGAPEKIVVDGNIVLERILGYPPSHADWITPINPLPDRDGCNSPPSPCLVNVSVKPSVPETTMRAFASQMSITDSSSTTSSRQSQTSWSVGGKVSAEGKITYGVPDFESVSVEVKASAAAMHKQKVAKFDSLMNGVTDDLTVATGFADYIYYVIERMNYFYYPVIGQKVCPAKSPGCSDDQKIPLYVVFSAPDRIQHGRGDGSGQDWYQPVHEPGNVLSYPWAGTSDPLALLRQQFPNLTLDEQSQENTDWEQTDTSGSSYSTTWTQSSGQGKTSGSSTQENASSSVTVSGEATGEFGNVSASATVQVNQSSSFRTLRRSMVTLSSSNGITVTKPPFDEEVAGTGAYRYGFIGSIFGLQNPPDEAPPQPSSLDVDIQTTSPIVSDFLADLTVQDGNGTGWGIAYGQQADVALNHPQRWDWETTTQTLRFFPPVADFAKGTVPEFYYMRGFFITPADADGAGPNRTILNPAEADGYNLQVRVYNYSLLDTNAAGAARIRVRIYGQRVDTSATALSGDAFVIGDATIGTIPGFDSSSNQGTLPNWTLASVPFNPSAFPQTRNGNVYLVFWTVVWMEDSAGNLVPEVPDHGLTANPSALTITQMTQVPIQSHSNNIGVYGYGMPIFVCPPAPAVCTPTSGSGEPGATDSFVSVSNVAVPSLPLFVDKKVTVSARLTSHDFSGSMSVAYWDGDPDNGGTMFDLRHIPHIRAQDTYETTAAYRPQTCGRHTIFVVAQPDRDAPETASAAVDVTIDANAAIGTLRGKINLLHLGSGTNPLLQDLEQAQKQLAKGKPSVAANHLRVFSKHVRERRYAGIPGLDAPFFASLADLTATCVQVPVGPMRSTKFEAH